MTFTLHALLETSARARPEQVAVVDGERTLTYRQLDQRSNQVAHNLICSGVRRGDRVGLYLDKSLEAVVGLYGAMKAGAAYVPIDVGAPASRAAYIVGNCGIRHLVSHSARSQAWEQLATGESPLRHIMVMDRDDPPPVPEGVTAHPPSEVARHPVGSPEVGAIDLDLAYILYTSGSTGAPKGVKLTHLNALTFVNWVVAEFGIDAADRLSSHAPFHFDLSVLDLYVAAAVGAPVVLVPGKASLFPIQLARWIDEQRITVWYSVPSILSMMVQRGKLDEAGLPALRVLLFAGEVFPTKYLRQLMEMLPHVEFANLYGPTETNVCTYYRVPTPPDPDSGDIPIGRAIANVDTFVVTADGRPAKPGDTGELYVRGSTVMRGYWGDPELTAGRLIPDPFGTEIVDPVFRTGDLVRELDDGNYQFLGRRDNQIKSRGYRIELGEIETALYTHPAVVECAVIPIPDDLITNRIKAFVALRSDVTDQDLIRHCDARMPGYMVPEMWERRQALPKTSTGKIDRQTLAKGEA